MQDRCQCHEIYCFRFFHESSSPKPLKISFGPLKKFAEIFVSQGAPLLSMTPVANLPPFHLPPVSTTALVHLELRIYPRIFQKVRIGANGILRGLVETDLRKKPEVKKRGKFPTLFTFLSPPSGSETLQVQHYKTYTHVTQSHDTSILV